MFPGVKIVEYLESRNRATVLSDIMYEMGFVNNIEENFGELKKSSTFEAVNKTMRK